MWVSRTGDERRIYQVVSNTWMQRHTAGRRLTHGQQQVGAEERGVEVVERVKDGRLHAVCGQAWSKGLVLSLRGGRSGAAREVAVNYNCTHGHISVRLNNVGCSWCQTAGTQCVTTHRGRHRRAASPASSSAYAATSVRRSRAMTPARKRSSRTTCAWQQGCVTSVSHSNK